MLLLGDFGAQQFRRYLLLLFALLQKLLQSLALGGVHQGRQIGGFGLERAGLQMGLPVGVCRLELCVTLLQGGLELRDAALQLVELLGQCRDAGRAIGQRIGRVDLEFRWRRDIGGAQIRKAFAPLRQLLRDADAFHALHHQFAVQRLQSFLRPAPFDALGLALAKPCGDVVGQRFVVREACFADGGEQMGFDLVEMTEYRFQCGLVVLLAHRQVLRRLGELHLAFARGLQLRK